MHNESRAEREPEPVVKESKLRKFGPAIFWGSMIAMPALNLAAAYFGYKDTQKQLELAKLKDIAGTVAK